MRKERENAAASFRRAAKQEPARCALFLDVDGTLAPVVRRADDALVPTEVSRVVGRLSARLGLVACVSGRSAADAKRLVGVGGVVYAGAHGAELINPVTGETERAPELAAWQAPIQEFVGAIDPAGLRRAGVRLEDKSFIQALHWRGTDHPEEAEQLIEDAARAARERGFEIHRGRMVLEIRPPIDFNKGLAVSRLVKQGAYDFAAYVGDDNTDVDAFDALLTLEARGDLQQALCVGVASEESPQRLIDAADLMVAGTAGVASFLQEL